MLVKAKKKILIYRKNKQNTYCFEGILKCWDFKIFCVIWVFRQVVHFIYADSGGKGVLKKHQNY